MQQKVGKDVKAQSIHPIKIFYCYAHEDDALRKQLAKHLSPLRRLRDITGWFDRDIQAGGEWERESEKHLDTASIILVLVSADFMASDYCYTVEMTRALDRHREGTVCVIPILLRPVEWERTPLGELSPLPANRIPVTQWANPDAAWLNVVQGISDIVRKLLPKQLLSFQATDILYTKQGPLSGQTIGEKYLLGDLIGEGGFSQVYKAQHLQIQRLQAIKVLLERHFRKSEFRDRFLREAQTIASLDHSHIIHLDDFWVEASQAYLVMPFMSRGTLQDILQKHQGFLEQDQIVFYLEQICAALGYAHKQGIAHLDLKPLNLLIHADGRLLLSDFGLAHFMKQGEIEGGSSLRMGTPHFMAPEHIKGSPDKRSDLFSLGVILYQMLVGRLPFDGLPPETILLKNITEWPPAPRALRPELPKSVEDMLARALAKRPEQRYQTAKEFLIAFKDALVLTPNLHLEPKVIPHKSVTKSSWLWKLPRISLLNNPEEVKMQMLGDDTSTLAETIQETLRSHRVDAEVRLGDISIGPTIIRFGIRPTGKPEMKLDEKTGKMVPVKDAAGNIIYKVRTRVSRIMALQNDLALVLEKNIRMEAPVPGRPYVGVEIPNKNGRLVTLREVLESKEYQASRAKSKLTVALGKDVAGLVRIGDLARMQHLLIAATIDTDRSFFKYNNCEHFNTGNA